MGAASARHWHRASSATSIPASLPNRPSATQCRPVAGFYGEHRLTSSMWFPKALFLRFRARQTCRAENKSIAEKTSHMSGVVRTQGMRHVPEQILI
jgi:hypothetical protein